ncbi:MAG: AAA family ATPase [Armatimonadetes bacterium]|nr:AAA family ATPase [Armatimonadota bacterium]
MTTFQKAERRRAKARILIEGPSGSGKSYSALRLAKGFGGKIAAIDTEHGSLSMYSDVTDFDVMDMSAPFSPQRYVEAIKAAEEAGYDVLIIDSITHEWSGEGGCLDILEKTPAPGGNQWGRWAAVTPLHQRFIETMLQSSLHIIATTRSKTEWAQGDDKKPKKLGLAPQQRDGIDYEFTMVFSVQADNHVASVTKDRTAQFDEYLQIIDEKTGAKIVKWLESGADVPVPTAPAEVSDNDLKELREHVRSQAKAAGMAAGQFMALIKSVQPNGRLVECTERQLNDISAKLNGGQK